MREQTSNLNEAASAIDLAYCRAAIYSALAIGFQEPRLESLCRLLAEEGKSSLAAAVATLYPSQPDLISLLETFPSADGETIAGLSTRYRGLFGHTARGPVPPYETEYGNEAIFQQPQELGDLMGFYNAFGLRLKADPRERPDHVSCECEFLMFLALKEAYALEQDNQEMLAATRKAGRLFLRDHLARFFPTFAAKLNGHESSGFYASLAEFGLRWVAAECARLQVSRGAASLELRPVDDNRVPMACGSGAGCAAMPGACAPEDGDSL